MFFVTRGNMGFPDNPVSCDDFMSVVKSELIRHKAADVCAEGNQITFRGNIFRGVSTGNILNHVGKGTIYFTPSDGYYDVSFHLTHYAHQISTFFAVPLMSLVVTLGIFGGDSFSVLGYLCCVAVLLFFCFIVVFIGKYRFRRLISNSYKKCLNKGIGLKR